MESAQSHAVLRTYPRRANWNSCIGVHVDDMLAVDPIEVTKNLWQKLSIHMAMPSGLVTDKPQEFLGLCAAHCKDTNLKFRVTSLQSCAKIWFWRTQGIQHTQS